MPAGMDAEAALAYAERHTLHGLLIDVDGTIVLERYANGYDCGQAARALQRHEELLGRDRGGGARRRLARTRRTRGADVPGVVGRCTARARHAARTARAHQRHRLRRLGFGGAAVRARASHTDQRRTRRKVHLRRHSAASIRRGARTQTRAARSDAARLSARTAARPDRRTRRLVALAQRRHAAAADRRVSHRARVAEVRPLRLEPRSLERQAAGERNVARAMLHRLGGQPALRARLVARPDRHTARHRPRQRLRRPSDVPHPLRARRRRKIRPIIVVQTRRVFEAAAELRDFPNMRNRRRAGMRTRGRSRRPCRVCRRLPHSRRSSCAFRPCRRRSRVPCPCRR